MDLGDRTEDSTLNFHFFTTDASNSPTTLSGTPALSVFKDDGTTESTAGITLNVDFDSLTGLNHVTIDTSADAFYATGADYSVVITTGTVDGVSVVGAVLATFSIENRHEPMQDAGALAGQEAPSATATPQEMIQWLYTAFRNKKTNDGSETKLFADDGSTVNAKQSTSESAGTVTKAEWISGA